MLESEELNVFSVQVERDTALSAFLQSKSQHELQRRTEGLQELFLDGAVLTEQHGTALQNIQQSVLSTEVVAQEDVSHLEEALASDHNPFKKLFCGCRPCYNE